jgi:serine/threonine protein kinase
MHCNIKPSNILIGKDGTIKLTDFAWMKKISVNGNDHRK